MGLSAHVFGETCYFNSSDGYPAGDPAEPNPAPGEAIKIQATLNQPDWNYQIGERYDPFNGNWMTRTQLSVTLPDQIDRGKDYNHSGFCDLIISGLVGLDSPGPGILTVTPLVPEDWDWFCLDRVRLQGRDVTVVWDRDGSQFNRGAGFRVFVDGGLRYQSNSPVNLTLNLNEPFLPHSS